MLNTRYNACCSDPSWGGGGTIYSTGSFAQTILTDRYIHHIELWVVSFKSPSSVEYGIKKMFWMSFSGASYRGFNHVNIRSICVISIHIFWKFFAKIFVNVAKMCRYWRIEIWVSRFLDFVASCFRWHSSRLLLNVVCAFLFCPQPSVSPTKLVFAVKTTIFSNNCRQLLNYYYLGPLIFRSKNSIVLVLSFFVRCLHTFFMTLIFQNGINS